MVGDPFKYFRIEARELLQSLSQGILELEKDAAGAPVIGRLLRAAHTLKGASRVVKQPEIAKLAHALEDVLAPYRDTSAPVSRKCIDEMLRIVDLIGPRISSLDTRIESGPAELPRAIADEQFETVRVEIGELDNLFEGVSEAGAELNALRPEVAEIEKTLTLAKLLGEQSSKRRHAGRDVPGAMHNRIQTLTEDILTSLVRLQRNLGAHLDQAERELAQVRRETDRLRLVPASELFASLERAIRDAAQSVQKRVELKTCGGENRMNAHVLGELRSALIHAVRNSVAHGIETELERRAAGKPPAGTVELSVERHGNRVAFICKDDGRGIDVQAIRLAAVRCKLISASEAASLGLDDAIRLILKGGVTTMGQVTEVAGRGIGLDVVREVAARLKGSVALRSEQGLGTTLELCVPMSLSSLPALVTDAGGVAVSVPIDAVRGSLLVRDGDITRSADGDSIVYKDRLIPFIPLARLLGKNSQGSRSRKSWSAVVLQSESDLTALGVDRLLGITDVVLRPLPSWLGADPIVAGAALDAKGHPQLVLDPAGLMAAVRALAGGVAERPVSRPPVLIIDDSLTTRMLEQSILESAGYQVELAISGEEGLAKARSRKYGVFIVDIEMPGIDGFEFMRQVRSDPALRDVPSLLVTSRGAAEDRRHGEELGARAYIVKSEFDQGYLLKTLGELIG
jgi:two-component system chemotaxis sensor kinase CheA